MSGDDCVKHNSSQETYRLQTLKQARANSQPIDDLIGDWELSRPEAT